MTLRGDTGVLPITSTVLQNVEVLSTGERLQPDPGGKPQNVREVTLLLSPEGAQKLVLASNQGMIQFVLRNGGDQEVKDREPVSIRDLQAGYASRAAAPKAVASAAKPRAKPAGDDYQIEIFNGTKRGAVAF
jgi:pilus assembly protein CpaB